LDHFALWITLHFHNGKEITDPPLQEWVDEGGTALVKEKTFFLMLSPPPPPIAEFNPLGRWVASIRNMICGGFSARTNYDTELNIS
jgi:hypothetical protein